MGAKKITGFPISALTNAEYAKSRAAEIDMKASGGVIKEFDPSGRAVKKDVDLAVLRGKADKRIRGYAGVADSNELRPSPLGETQPLPQGSDLADPLRPQQSALAGSPRGLGRNK